MTRVKICGITNYSDAKASVDFGADAIGFIFYKKSKRYIKPIEAKKIINKLPPFFVKVGVFVNENYEVILKIASNLKLNAIQLHGSENLSFCKKISKYFSVIKAIPIEKIDDPLAGLKYKNYATILFDTKTKNFGGSGKTFDWNIILKYKNKFENFILSGGLNLENVEYAIKLLKPYAVDVSSGVESQIGVKDHKKLKKFIEIVKAIK